MVVLSKTRFQAGEGWVGIIRRLRARCKLGGGGGGEGGNYLSVKRVRNITLTAF